MSITSKKKEITKLLLKGCSCENCKFSHTNLNKPWCKNKKRRPKSGACIAWEKRLNLSALFDVVKVGYPNIVASDIIGEYPMKKVTREVSLISKILNGEKIEIENILNGKRIDKKSSKK